VLRSACDSQLQVTEPMVGGTYYLSQSCRSFCSDNRMNEALLVNTMYSPRGKLTRPELVVPLHRKAPGVAWSELVHTRRIK